MQKLVGFYFTLLLALLGLGWGTANATTFLEFQSTVLGDGWFQYRMSVMNDPFFTEADITLLGINFTNQIDQSSGSTKWSYAGPSGTSSDWSFSNGYPARPYTVTFLIRSSEPSFKLGSSTNDQGGIVLLSLYLSEFYPGRDASMGSGNIIGYAKMPCLVPCTPAEADGSPTNFVYDLKLLPDVQINRMVQDNGVIDGVDFNYDYASTFLLQGTSDFNHWTNIAYLWSYPPETVWTTNKSLGNYGQYFRVAIVAGDHTTNLPPLSSMPHVVSQPKAVASVTVTRPSVTGCQFANGRLTVNLATQAGQQVQVQAVNAHGTVFQTQQVLAQGNFATVNFDTTGLPSPVFFKTTSAQ